jgi:ATP-dependent Clp protease ATP-binding subunit ClpB
MEINSKPEELDVLDRKVMQLEIEIEAIKEKRAIKLKILDMDLANLKEDRNEIYEMEIRERCSDNIQAVKPIEDLNTKLNAERDGDYGKVAEIRYGKSKPKKIRCISKQLRSN